MGNVMLTFCDAVTKTMRKCLLSYFRGFDSKSIELTQLQLPIHNMEKLGNIQKKKLFQVLMFIDAYYDLHVYRKDLVEHQDGYDLFEFLNSLTYH